MCLEEQAWKLIVLRHTSRDISELEEQRRAPLQRGGYWKRNVGILKLFFFLRELTSFLSSVYFVFFREG